MPQLTWSALDHTLIWCPNLLSLCISVDYISDVFFESQNVPIGHPLRILELECSESAATEVGISPDSIWFAIDNGCLPNLRCIRISARLAWQATRSLRSSVSDLVDRLEEEEEKTPLGIDTGVWEHFFWGEQWYTRICWCFQLKSTVADTWWPNFRGMDISRTKLACR